MMKHLFCHEIQLYGERYVFQWKIHSMMKHMKEVEMFCESSKVQMMFGGAGDRSEKELGMNVMKYLAQKKLYGSSKTAIKHMHPFSDEEKRLSVREFLKRYPARVQM